MELSTINILWQTSTLSWVTGSGAGVLTGSSIKAAAAVWVDKEDLTMSYCAVIYLAKWVKDVADGSNSSLVL